MEDGDKHASLTDIMMTLGKLAEIQGKINSGEIQIEDQHESYERDKQELKELLKEEQAKKAYYRKMSKPTMSKAPTTFSEFAKK